MNMMRRFVVLSLRLTEYFLRKMKYTNTNIQLHNYTNTQIHKYTNTNKQIHKYRRKKCNKSVTGLESLNQVKISFVKVSLCSAYGLRDVLSLSTEIIKEIVFLLVLMF